MKEHTELEEQLFKYIQELLFMINIYDMALQYHNMDTERIFKWANENIQKEDSINKYHSMIEVLNSEFATCASQRMTHCNGASVDIYFCRIKAGLPDNGQCLRGESFIQLDQINLRKIHPRLFQYFGNSGHRANTHDAGMHSGHSAVNEPADWF